jgi:hypothetical protein
MTANGKRYVVVASVGAAIGGAGAFVYGNVNALERMAAEASGMPLWSWHQLPFTLPWAILGAFIAVGLRWLNLRRM